MTRHLSRPRRAIGVLAWLVGIAPAALGMAVVPAGIASAAVVSPLTLTYSEALYGDVVHIGNGVLACPPGGGSPFTTALCQDGQNRTDRNALNDRYNMEWNDIDGGGPLFNGSSGQLTVPPGSTVAYAQLSWAGNTGVFRTSGGTLVGPGTNNQACGAQQQTAGVPSVIPPGTPQGQAVSLSINGGPAMTTPPEGFVTEPVPTANGSSQYYSAHADVSGHFADAPTGVPLTVQVGDVWTPEGYNCFGGWSLTLVYSYPEPEPTYAPHLRQVYVYTGHVRQNPGDPDTDTVIDGFVYAGGDIQLGITAYEGNWGLSGDYFEINGTRLAEPQIGGTDNFFISATDGSASPNVLNNFSVDAKTMEIRESLGLIPLDATSADLAFGTTGDAYMAQLLVFSVPVAELQLNKQVCHSADPDNCGPGGPGPWEKSTAVPLGETAYWRITVTNPSGLDITGATLHDDAEPACAHAAGTFDVAAGDSTSFYCATANVTESTTNSVTTSFVPPGAPPGTPPTESPPSQAGAEPYGMSVSKQVCGSPDAADCEPDGAGPWGQRATVPAGGTAYWRITVVNTGALPLQDVVLNDDSEPSCARAAGTFSLPAGEIRQFFCATKDVTEPLVNGVTVAAAPPPEGPPDAPPVTAAGDAAVRPTGKLANTGSGTVVPLATTGAGLVIAGGILLALARGGSARVSRAVRRPAGQQPGGAARRRRSGW